MTYPQAVARAGHPDGNALFDAILNSPSGVTFTVHDYEDDFALITHADRKIALAIPEMLDEIKGLVSRPAQLTTPEFPIVLSAGERRAYTANDILRDPSWRKRDQQGLCGSVRRMHNSSVSLTVKGFGSRQRPVPPRPRSRSAT